MSFGAESVPPRAGRVSCPLLVQCDLSGRVVWMSDRTRTLLGEPDRLLETLLVSGVRRPWQVWRVWEARDGVIVGARKAELIEDASGGLLPVQVSLLNHFFKLLATERRLSQRARLSRPGSGRKAIQQMELERRRLARELHTGAGQMLAAIRLQLELIAGEMPDPPPRVHDALQRIGMLASETLEQLRSISRRLHPPEWQRLTIQEAIRQLWELSGIPQRFEAELYLDSLPREPDLEVKVLLYRATQEALSNLVRHAKASQVRASLQVMGERLTLSIVDNGIGFDAGRILRGPADVATGIGLRSVREQAEALGGKMTIESGPSGTKLVVSVVVSPAES